MSNDELPNYLERILASPNVAEVERMFPLPDLRTIPSLSPIDAFKEFMHYADVAIGNVFRVPFRGALEREAFLANERALPNGRPIFGSITTEQRKANTVAESKAVAERFAPLLPAMRNYVEQRSQDPTVHNRLAWMSDKVEVVINDLTGRPPTRGVWVPDHSAEAVTGGTPNATLREWGELWDGIAAMIANIGNTHNAPARSFPAIANADRIEWQGSTIEFVTIFKKLEERRYVDLPSTGGKQGEGNLTEYIRRLQQLFIVRKEDGEELTTESLAQRWRGKPMAHEREQQFDIPEATRKRPSE